MIVREGHIRFGCRQRNLALLRRLRCVEQLWAVVAERDGLLTGQHSDEARHADLAALEAFGRDEGNWTVALQAWQALLSVDAASKLATAKVEDQQLGDSLRFRAKCKRAESATGHTHKEHGFTSIDAARVFGGALKQRFGWQVGLERGTFDIDIRLAIAGKSCRALLLLTNTVSRGVCGGFAPSRSKLSLSRTALRPTVASAMAQLRHERPAEIVVDPMSGGGSIGCEVAAGWPGAFVLNGDCEQKEAARLAKNLGSLRRRLDTAVLRRGKCTGAEKEDSVLDLSWAARMEGARWDATRLPLRNGVVDSVVTDLPWGKVIREYTAQHATDCLYSMALRFERDQTTGRSSCIFATSPLDCDALMRASLSVLGDRP